jgi:hypothetical protein
VNRLRAATQDRRIPGLEAQHRRVTGDVRTALVNDADGADGHPHLLKLDAIRTAPAIQNLSHRIWQRRHLLDATRDGVHPLFVQTQAIQHRLAQTLGLARLQILRICREDGRSLGTQLGSHRQQDGVFLPSAQLGQPMRRSAGLTAHGFDHRKNVGLGHIDLWKKLVTLLGVEARGKTGLSREDPAQTLRLATVGDVRGDPCFHRMLHRLELRGHAADGEPSPLILSIA